MPYPLTVTLQQLRHDSERDAAEAAAGAAAGAAQQAMFVAMCNGEAPWQKGDGHETV